MLGAVQTRKTWDCTARFFLEIPACIFMGAGRHPKIFNLVSGLSANSVPQNLMVHHHFPFKKKAIDGHRLGSPLFSEFPEKFRHSQVICLFFRPAGSDSVRQVQQARESHCASLVAGVKKHNHFGHEILLLSAVTIKC